VLGVDGEVQSVQLKDFDTQKSLFKDQFKGTLFSRSTFLKAWNHIRGKTFVHVETEMTIELESRTLHANEDFAMNEKVMGFWKLEKKWYNATVLEKTKSGYKVVFADDNLVRVLGLQNLRQKTSR
ncbi:Hypothetical predicted protein, partial [Mytilus galloprovincialis]